MTQNMRETFAWLRERGFMVPMRTVRERTLFSQGFDRGNYGNAYESNDWEAWSEKNLYTERSQAYRAGMVLGFFSSYELHEIDDELVHDEVATLRAEWRAEIGE